MLIISILHSKTLATLAHVYADGVTKQFHIAKGKNFQCMLQLQQWEKGA